MRELSYPWLADFLKLLDDRVLILDGGMGTSLHRYHPTDNDWGYAPDAANRC